ncbi:fn3_6 domain-containing protein [Psidium guajava]|nr:fn3_6 domain-containing protein [Psidium guajava]
MLPRPPAQGAAVLEREARPQPDLDPRLRLRLRCVVAARDLDGSARGSFAASRGGPRGRSARDGGGAEQVRGLQAARGALGVQVPVRRDVLRVPQVPGAARVRLRLQGDGEGADLEGQPGRGRREAREDMKVEPRSIPIMRLPRCCEQFVADRQWSPDGGIGRRRWLLRASLFDICKMYDDVPACLR